MAWYVWVVIAICAILFGIMIFALMRANEPFRDLDDQEQIEYMQKLKEKKKE